MNKNKNLTTHKRKIVNILKHTFITIAQKLMYYDHIFS